jgi:hypothetical protein
LKYSHYLATAVTALSLFWNTQMSEAKAFQDTPPILDYSNFDQYSGQELYEYHTALFGIFTELENFQADESLQKKKTAFFIKLMEESVANTETDPPYKLGNECLIGGYWGQLISTSTKSMTCDSPNRCTTSSGGSGHVCNPTFFTYQNPASGKAICAPLTRDLTTTGCLPQFDKMYKEMCGNTDKSCEKFAAHFKASVKKATGKSDPKTMRKYVAKIFEEYERIRQYCFDSKGKIKPHVMGQKESCFRLKSQYERLTKIYENTRSADFSCIDTGLSKAGYDPNMARAQVTLLSVRAKEITDTVAPYKWWGIRTREIDAKRGVIMSLASVGVCQNTPLSDDKRAQANGHLGQFKMNDIPAGEYQTLFGASPSIIKDGGLGSPSYTTRAKNWNTSAGSLANCERKTLDRAGQIKLCKALHKSCGMGAGICEGREGGSDNGRVNGGGGDDGGVSGGDDGGGSDDGSDSKDDSETGNGENTTPDRGGGHGDPD